MKDSFPSIHYQSVKEINYLKDIRQQNSHDKAQKFNSDRQMFSSIAQKLYKKIVKQGYIQKPKEFAISQTKKKVEHMYDLSDKWIDDEEVITEPESQKMSSDFHQYRCVSGISIEDFYKNQKGKNFPSPQKIQEEQKPRIQYLKLNEISKSPLTVLKMNELKKKIQQNLKERNVLK